MFHSSSIARLYASVLHEDIVQYGISEKEIRRGIQIMASVYSPDPTSLQLDNVDAPNYNEIGLRCAYLHKYAAFHTALVLHAMDKILEDHGPLFKELVTASQFKLCCLGGGPGTDAIGILAALNIAFGNFRKDVTIVDIMENWKFTFDALIQQIIYGNYSIQKNFLRDYFQWNYVGLNLLDSMSSAANTAISNANFISMVKFISAAACQDTESMVTKIFKVMKPGALVLFIDNAAGGFHQLVRKAANQVGLKSIFGPLNHYKYSNEELRITRFGYTSCCLTTVSIHLLQKPHRNQQTKSHNPNHLQRRNSNAPTAVSRQPLPTMDTFSNSKLHSSHNSFSSGKNTNLNKSCYSNEINSATHNVSPPKDQKLNNKCPKTSLNQVPKRMTHTNNQSSYSYSPSEPVSHVINSTKRDMSPIQTDYNNSYSYTHSDYHASYSYSPYITPEPVSHAVNPAKPNVSPTKSNYRASYSYIPSEPVLPIYNNSPRSSAQSQPDAFHESSNNSDDGCCSCCVIS